MWFHCFLNSSFHIRKGFHQKLKILSDNCILDKTIEHTLPQKMFLQMEKKNPFLKHVCCICIVNCIQKKLSKKSYPQRSHVKSFIQKFCTFLQDFDPKMKKNESKVLSRSFIQIFVYPKCTWLILSYFIIGTKSF